MLITSQQRSSKTSIRRDLITQAVSNATSTCVGDLFSDAAYTPYSRFNDVESGEEGGVQLLADEIVGIDQFPNVMAASDNYYIINRKGSNELEFWKRYGSDSWELFYTDTSAVDNYNGLYTTHLADDNTFLVTSNDNGGVYQYKIDTLHNVTKTQVILNKNNIEISGNTGSKLATSRNGQYFVLYTTGVQNTSNTNIAFKFFTKQSGDYVEVDTGKIGPNFIQLPFKGNTDVISASEFVGDNGVFGANCSLNEFTSSQLFFYKWNGATAESYSWTNPAGGGYEMFWIDRTGNNVGYKSNDNTITFRGILREDKVLSTIGFTELNPFFDESKLSDDGLTYIDIIPKTNPSIEKVTVNVHRSTSWTTYDLVLEQTWDGVYPTTLYTTMSNSGDTVVQIDTLIDGSLAQYTIRGINTLNVDPIIIELGSVLMCSSAVLGNIAGDVTGLQSIIESNSSSKLHDYSPYISEQLINKTYTNNSYNDVKLNDEFIMVAQTTNTTTPLTRQWDCYRRFDQTWRYTETLVSNYQPTGFVGSPTSSIVTENNEWAACIAQGGAGSDIIRVFRFDNLTSSWGVVQDIPLTERHSACKPVMSPNGKYLLIAESVIDVLTLYERNDTTKEYELLGSPTPLHVTSLGTTSGADPATISNNAIFSTGEYNQGFSITSWTGSGFEYQDFDISQLPDNVFPTLINDKGTLLTGSNNYAPSATVNVYQLINGTWEITGASNNSAGWWANADVSKTVGTDEVAYSYYPGVWEDKETFSPFLTGQHTVSLTGYFTANLVSGTNELQIFSSEQAPSINLWRGGIHATSAVSAPLGYEMVIDTDINATSGMVSSTSFIIFSETEINNTSSVTATLSWIVNFDSDLATTSSVESDFLRMREAQTSLEAVSSLEATHNYFRDLDSDLTNTSTVTATHNYYRDLDSNLLGTSDVSGTLDFLKEANIDCVSAVISQVSRDTTINETNISATSSVIANIDYTIELETTIECTSSMLGRNSWDGVTTIVATSQIDALFDRDWILDTEIVGTSSVIADQDRIRVFETAIDAVSVIDSAPVVDGNLLTNIVCSSSVTSQMAGSKQFNSVIECTSSVDEYLERDWELDTQIDSASFIEAEFLRIREAQTQIAAVSEVIQRLERVIDLDTAITGTSQVTGTLVGEIIMSASVFGQSVFTANIIVDSDVNDLLLTWTYEQDLTEPSKEQWIANISEEEIEDEFEI